MSSQYREGHREGVNDAKKGLDGTLEVQADCDNPETCDYCRGYRDGLAEVPARA